MLQRASSSNVSISLVLEYGARDSAAHEDTCQSTRAKIEISLTFRLEWFLDDGAP